MNPAIVVSILKLVVDEAPAVMRMIEDIRKGKEPTEADWKELELLGAYSSEDAKKK
jgi:hypothetical protein